MKKMLVMTVVGTRPEIIRLSRIIFKLDEHCEHILVHTGQNYDYELNEIFFNNLEVRRPDYFLDAAGKNASETIGKVITKIDRLLSKMMPDALLVLGDTNSGLSVIPAKKRKIPIFHMEAGNRCFDQRVPEETNRRIIDHTSDINLTYSSIAREYLLREGFNPDMVIKTGSPMKEVLMHNINEINKSNILKTLHLKQNQYFVISAHREENINTIKNFQKLIAILNTLGEKFNLPIIVSTHPRTQNQITKSKAKFHEKVRLIKPLGYTDYVKLQMCSKVVISDSGTISEESSILNFPALNIREAHERPEAMEEASVMMVGLDIDRVLQGISILDNQTKGSRRILNNVFDYSSQNVSEKVVRIIHSYTDYVRKVSWREY